MRVVVAGAVVLACGLGGLAAPLSAAASPAAARVRAAAEPVTRITSTPGKATASTTAWAPSWAAAATPAT